MTRTNQVARRTGRDPANEAAVKARIAALVTSIKGRFDFDSAEVTEQGPAEHLSSWDETDGHDAEMVERIKATARDWREQMESQLEKRQVRQAREEK